MSNPFKIKKLHPTLKACKCGFIGTSGQLYKHYDSNKFRQIPDCDFFAQHGEVPLNEDDPRTQVDLQLKQSLLKVHPSCPKPFEGGKTK